MGRNSQFTIVKRLRLYLIILFGCVCMDLLGVQSVILRKKSKSTPGITAKIYYKVSLVPRHLMRNGQQM